MILEESRVRLFVDGQQLADQAVKFNKGASVAGGLAFGSLAGREIGCRGLIDEVRLTAGIRQITLPTAPFEADAQTIGLWHLDEMNAERRFQDASKLKAPALADAEGVKKKSLTSPRPKTISVNLSSGSNGRKGTVSTIAGG